MKEVKVRFELDIQEDGFPPISVETLNADPVDINTVRLDNTPFFAEHVAVDDVLSCRKTEDDHIYKYEKVIAPSGNKSISIVFIDPDCEDEIYQYFKERGCYCEYGEFASFNMLAVSINGKLDYRKMASYLDEKESLKKLSYAELCI